MEIFRSLNTNVTIGKGDRESIPVIKGGANIARRPWTLEPSRNRM
ncbi:uncharacterized protein G2W53_007113 [Senna tora]|uniref:Uncharacterized protein n=1 Tax=Senna tora TaxID=362788 RepID=A0A835CD87_9FABA|nr:uncharacterized protein G2W53_007113 [Senna tora]